MMMAKSDGWEKYTHVQVLRGSYLASRLICGLVGAIQLYSFQVDVQRSNYVLVR